MSRPWQIAALERHYNTALSILDRVQIGLCVALENGFIVIKNTEADKIFAVGNNLMLDRRGVLACKNVKQNGELRRVIKLMSRVGSPELSTYEMLCESDKGNAEDALLIEIIPLQYRQEESTDLLHGALLTLINPLQRSFSTARATAMFGLTVKEGLVCEMLVEGKTGREIAKSRNVSPETIKTQVKSVFRKTNSSSRSELIKRLLALSPPIEN
jgi:DNA-binding CsgD family transcriptional regulator